MAHAHHHPVSMPVAEQQGIRRGAAFIIGGLTSGHGVFHWFTQSFIVMLPEVRLAFGLSAVQVGSITAVRELTSGIVSLPGGVLTDLLRRHWGLVLASCMALFGIGWLVMGFSPIYPLLLVGMALVAMASSTWHLSAMAALSHRFAHRRGSALSFHGVGGNIGDVAAPAVTGFLLLVMAWQDIIKIYAVIPLFLAFLVFWAFRDIGRAGNEDRHRPNVPAQIAQTRTLLKRTPRLWAITLVGGLRGMAFSSFITILPLYLTDELGLTAQVRGLYIALLMLVGIGFTPLMGYLSDRFNRKLILIPGMLFLGVMTLLLVPLGDNQVALIAILALLGTFLFSDQPILTAAALDIVGSGVAATTLGVLSFSRFALSAISPVIGTALYQMNFDYTLYYIASIFGLAILILTFIPLPKVQHAGPELGRQVLQDGPGR
jgi:MFS transporter, FSR family, fosmidomycin resistance protein